MTEYESRLKQTAAALAGARQVLKLAEQQHQRAEQGLRDAQTEFETHLKELCKCVGRNITERAFRIGDEVVLVQLRGETPVVVITPLL